MNRRDALKAGLAGLALGLGRFPLGWAAGADTPKRRILVYTRSQAFEHSVVKRGKDGELSLAERILTELGDKHGFEVTCTKDGTEFEPENIGKYDAFFFETTGDLTQAEGTDTKSYSPKPMTPEGKKALIKAIADGKGFVGSHCASDTFHSPGVREENQTYGSIKMDPYIVMLGGEFIRHGSQQKARIRVVDPHFPGAPEDKEFELMEEWYALKNFAPDLHVILVQETEGMKTAGNDWYYNRPPYPETWARKYEKGRVFFTSMGHREDVWQNPLFQSLLLGGLSWAVGNVDADITPNLEKAAPKASELPEKPPEQPKKKEDKKEDKKEK
jgi:type 1 glutamine amidotransferase